MSLNKVIDKTYPSLSLKSRRLLIDLCEEQTNSIGSSIIQKGKQNTHEYFLIDGIARSYLLNPNGESITLLFFDNHDILTPHIIRTQKNKSLINIEAITECRLLKINSNDFGRLIESNLEIREFANTVLRSELIKKTNKEIQLISLGAKERLDQFRKDYHMLENRIPHNMIASFLGITNVSLSRLRKQV